MKCKYSVGRIILIVWVAFSIMYVGYTQYQHFQKMIAERSYQRGLQDAVVEVLKQAQECKAFPVTIGDQGAQLINVSCLKQPEGEGSAE